MSGPRAAPATPTSGRATGRAGPAVALIVARDGRLPPGADQAASQAGGRAVVVGSGARSGAAELAAADHVWWQETGRGLAPAALAAALAPALAEIALVILPASADGRDLAPRLAAQLGRPLLAGAEWVRLAPGDGPGPEPAVHAAVARLDDRVLVDVFAEGPVVATIVPRAHEAAPRTRKDPAELEPFAGLRGAGPRPPLAAAGPDAEVEAVLEPDLATLDLADARVVLAGGAGLAAGLDDEGARAAFTLLGRVANALGGAAGATRVATDAGWTGYERQIGTTGVAVDPDLYVALGISGAAQHLGGLGSPRHVVSVNVDSSTPMTAVADLGLVADAHALLVELARRLGVPVPRELDAAAGATAGAGGVTGRG